MFEADRGKTGTTVLVAEDEFEVRSYLGLALGSYGYKVEFAQDGEEALDRLGRRAEDVSLLLLDLIMPRKDGFETLKEVRKSWPHLPVITLSGFCTPASVASVLKGGASDFLPKPIAHEDLYRAIQRVLTPKANGIDQAPLRASRSDCGVPAPAGGTWSQQVESLLSRIGGSDAPVLLRGETGVGKEVFARELHARSKRAAKPFLKLNCAALPSELVESELFGYEKGAFTGAVRSTPGKFEIANKGTILLDEIGDMDFKLQAKLLQVLQDREFIRLGASEPSRVDVRVMAATHCPLEDAISKGRFREDLYYRLNILEIHVPPLRERKEEILSLADYFLMKHSPSEQVELPCKLQQVLLEHDWPGNVRQLENIVRKFLIFRSVEAIAVELRGKARIIGALRSASTAPTFDPPRSSELAEANEERRSDDASSTETGGLGMTDQKVVNGSRRSATLAECEETRRKSEKEIIFGVLHSTLWNRKQAAKLLNVDYKALLYKMKKLGIGEIPGRPSSRSQSGTE